MSNRNKLFFVFDIVIAIAAVLSLLTGIVWLLTGSGGYQGGHNPQTVILGLDRGAWSDLHTWFSLVMIAGALTHLALHWSWIAAMTRRLREGQARKARLNYYLDVILGAALILSALTGLVFLLGGGGYQGGRNPAFQATLLGLSRGTWSDLHTWVSLVMVAAVLIHQVFHWGWITNTIRRLFRPAGLSDRVHPRLSGAIGQTNNH